jgi:16S rRNA (adenine1518-N6/adenine1519-N6)-dimethyltransferase
MDALDFPYQRAARRLNTRLKIVGNIPYGISAPLMFTFLDQWDSFAMLVLMLQKEVAERLTALPRTKAYGVLTVLCGIRFHIRIRQKVSRHCFSPVPRVDSAVVQCLPHGKNPMHPHEERFFRKVVKSAFSQRRKTLFNALRSSPFLALQEKQLRPALEAAGIDPVARPETLTPEEFFRLARCIQAASDAQ